MKPEASINIRNRVKTISIKQAKMSHQTKLVIMFAAAILMCLLYLFINIDMKYFEYAMYLRQPKLWAMVLAAFCIGAASIAFQSVINNVIVTPCLLGMNGLYSLVKTTIFFFLGSGSVLVYNKYYSFTLDLIIMGVVATVIYGYLFRKTKYNVLYVLLAGTVLANLFGSLQSGMVRVMDPNEYDTLLSQLVAGFNNVNKEILTLATIITIGIVIVFWRDIRLLDVLTLGKAQAINLGVDYDKSVARILLGVTLLIAIATAVVGPISFLGLIIANLSRQMFRTFRHGYLLLGSTLFGIIILVGGQLVIEHILSFGTVISVFINIFGGTYFLYLIIKNKGA